MWNRDKKVLALDIGCQTIKALVLAGDGMDYSILKAASAELPRSNDQGWETHPREEITGALTYLFKKAGIKIKSHKHIISSLSGNSYSLKQIETLELDGDELDSSLQFEARKHLPARGDIIMDYQILKKMAGRLDVLLAVAQKSEVKNHIGILRSVGMYEGEVDLPPLGLLNLYVNRSHSNGKLLPDEKNRLIINMGSRFTQLCFLNNKHPLFIRELTLGGQDFTRELARKRNLSIDDAERDKIRNGLFNHLEDAKKDGSGLTLENQTKSVMDRFIGEVQRSVRFFGKDTGIRRVDEYLLTGGCLQDESLFRELETRFPGKVVRINPFKKIKITDECDNGNPYQYGICLGMAARKLDEILQN